EGGGPRRGRAGRCRGDQPMTRRHLFTFVLLAAGTVVVHAQEPQKETLDGVRNYTNVSPTIGCAGATEARVMPELARRGYRAVINLRQASEEGAAIEESRAAA